MFRVIYELGKKNVLTSINIGLYKLSNNKSDLGLAVYPVDDNLNLGAPLFEEIYPRTDGGVSTTFDVPDTELLPGTYFFEVRQLGENNVAVAYDGNDDGYFYDSTYG